MRRANVDALIEPDWSSLPSPPVVANVTTTPSRNCSATNSSDSDQNATEECLLEEAEAETTAEPKTPPVKRKRPRQGAAASNSPRQTYEVC